MQSLKQFNGERLRSARIYRNMTIAELADEVGITKQAISQFENGKSNPSYETLLQLINILNFPREYFYERDIENVKIGNTYFRALLTTNKKDRMSQIEKAKMISRIYYFLEKYIEFPQLNLPKIDYTTDDIEIIASKTRRYWGLDDGPITNIVRLLEKNGIIVASFATDCGLIDAFSQRQQINEKNYYIVVLGNDKNSAVRRQFDAAHELAHIILHDWSLDLEQISREEFRQMETEANNFAAAFLLPKSSFINDLIYPTNLEFYIELKRKWRVSIAAMIIRAYHLKVINYNQYQYLMRQMSKKGWRTREPLDDVIMLNKPTLLKKAIQILIENEVLLGDEILKEMSNNKLSLKREEVEKLLGLKEGTLINNKITPNILKIKTRAK